MYYKLCCLLVCTATICLLSIRSGDIMLCRFKEKGWDGVHTKSGGYGPQVAHKGKCVGRKRATFTGHVQANIP